MKEASGQPHAVAALPSGKEPLNRRLDGPQKVSAFWRREKSVAAAGIHMGMIWNDLLRYLSCILPSGSQWTCDAVADAAFHFIYESCLVLLNVDKQQTRKLQLLNTSLFLLVERPTLH